MPTRQNRISNIAAFWCPYISGNDTVGFIDIPKQILGNTPKFVFAGAMNGCSLVTTNSPVDPENFFRVYHNQHPDNLSSKPNIIIRNSEMDIISEVRYQHYANEGDINIAKQNALNFLFY